MLDSIDSLNNKLVTIKNVFRLLEALIVINVLKVDSLSTISIAIKKTV